MTVAVIGAGASGMVAAITAAEPKKNRIILFERQSRVGRKLLATGNGRCNLSNRGAGIAAYHGESPDFAGYALERFGAEATLDWFSGLGLVTVTESDGRVYPFSDQANSVVDVLRFAVDGAGIELQTGCEVTALRRDGRGFLLETGSGSVFADKVIVASGGAAGGKLGGGKSGYALLEGLGHSCTRLYPALVQIKTDPAWVRSLKGVRADAAIKLLRGGEKLAESAGEIQFTDYGVSGPAAFDLSRAVAAAGSDLTLRLDLMRGMTEKEITAILARRQRAFPALTTEDLLTGMLHNRLGRTMIRYGGRSLTTPLPGLNYLELSAIARDVKRFELPALGVAGMDNAQITAGGVPTREFDPQTLESRVCPGVFAAGEVLDIDGDCGGFNLQWAWSSGRLAGKLGSGIA